MQLPGSHTRLFLRTHNTAPPSASPARLDLRLRTSTVLSAVSSACLSSVLRSVLESTAGWGKTPTHIVGVLHGKQLQLERSFRLLGGVVSVEKSHISIVSLKARIVNVHQGSLRVVKGHACQQTSNCRPRASVPIRKQSPSHPFLRASNINVSVHQVGTVCDLGVAVRGGEDVIVAVKYGTQGLMVVKRRRFTWAGRLQLSKIMFGTHRHLIAHPVRRYFTESPRTAGRTVSAVACAPCQGAYQAAHFSHHRSPAEGTRGRAGTRRSVLFQPRRRRSPPKEGPAQPPWRLPPNLRPQSY